MTPSPRAEVELSDPRLRGYLERYLRRRMPPADADDALQAVYCAALEARTAPTEHEALRKWLTGIARRKVAAYYERTSREQLGDPPELEARPDPIEELSLMRWAERQVAECETDRAQETLEWMARESEGEKLEAIAAEARVSPARVRQRVFRLRRWMRARWALELAVALVAIAIVAWWLSRPDRTAKVAPAPSVSATPSPTPSTASQVPSVEPPKAPIEKPAPAPSSKSPVRTPGTAGTAWHPPPARSHNP